VEVYTYWKKNKFGGVDMDIKIKYKEVDKKARAQKEIIECLQDLKDGKIKFGYQAVAVVLPDVIDAIYKEDSKQIESIEIKHQVGMGYYPTTLSVNKDKLYIDNEPFTKAELEQYIKTLWLVHNQLE
jgi:hypothetical protein